MRAWLPTISVSETTISFFDGDAEGWLVFCEWLGFIISIEIVRRVRA